MVDPANLLGPESASAKADLDEPGTAGEFGKVDLSSRVHRNTGRRVSPTAYDARSAAAASLAINPAIGEAERIRRRDHPRHRI